MLNIGVIGCGAIGRDHIRRLHDLVPGCQVVACADYFEEAARKTAAQVRASGRSVAMEPMNPYERRILHSALQGFRGVTTYSEGEEPNRHVVIAPER